MSFGSVPFSHEQVFDVGLQYLYGERDTLKLRHVLSE